ncbi:MAG: hypothetical protein JNK82_31820 [Myxococcaceae bacterium]|nr:hypothetical protein [Myxococcaceae bacterium]
MLGLGSACGVQLKPETLVDKLRVLSIVAEPPEVKPGESAQLSALLLDPSSARTTVIWVGCEPDATGNNYTACNDTSGLLQPTSFTTFPEGVRILGIGNNASYASGVNLFDGVPEGDSTRFNGVVGPVLAVVIGEEIDPTSTNEELAELFARIERQEVKSVFALSRITVSEREPPNLNPRFEGLDVDGVALPKNAVLQVQPGQEVALHVHAAPGETYTLQLPTGREERTEPIVGAWYSTNGRFSQERFDVITGSDTFFLAPGSAEVPEDPVPQRRFGTLWLVLRDGRGGQAHTAVRFFTCDETLPEPKALTLTPPTAEGAPVSIKGMNLSSALDAVVGGIALVRGSYSTAQDAFLGDLPPELPPGTYPVTLRTKRCTSIETGLTLTIP